MYEFYIYDILIIFVNFVKIIGKISCLVVKICVVWWNCWKIICMVVIKGLKYRFWRYICSFVYLNFLYII